MIGAGESLADQVAIITGGAGGIGRGIGEELLAVGMRVLLADRDEAGVSAVAAEIGAAHAPVDVRDPLSVQHLFTAAVERFGQVNLLVNNAGMLTTAPVIELPVEDWDRVMEVNARGVFLCSQAAVRHMVSRGTGNIVNISSISGRRGDPGLSHYSASKFAVIGFSQALAGEVAEHGIRVNAVCPGLVDTSVLRNWTAAHATTPQETAGVYQLIKRPQTAREIGRAVVFLASMPSITGQALNVDGGTILS
jgi:meso-butanediol dehydrogenase / (S,S)-butanediol dehydrogenase / diacetyl reductase